MSDHVIDRAEAYWRDTLSVGERTAIAEHLARCPDCRDAFASVRVAMRALAAAPSSRTDAKLEDLVIARARRRTLARRVSGQVAAAVLAIACTSVGFAAGRVTRPPVSLTAPIDSSLHQYIMLLEEPTWPPSAPLDRTGYREWAQALQSEHRYVGAEKLTEEPGYRIDGSGAAEPAVRASPAANYSGWYIVRAHDYADAIAMARRGPHLAYGSILVRQLE